LIEITPTFEEFENLDKDEFGMEERQAFYNNIFSRGIEIRKPKQFSHHTNDLKRV